MMYKYIAAVVHMIHVAGFAPYEYVMYSMMLVTAVTDCCSQVTAAVHMIHVAGFAPCV